MKVSRPEAAASSGEAVLEVKPLSRTISLGGQVRDHDG